MARYRTERETDRQRRDIQTEKLDTSRQRHTVKQRRDRELQTGRDNVIVALLTYIQLQYSKRTSGETPTLPLRMPTQHA